MAKIKVEQDTGTITVSIAGETSKRYKVTAGTISVHKDDAERVVAAIPGATLQDAQGAEELEPDDTPPSLPTPDQRRQGTTS